MSLSLRGRAGVYAAHMFHMCRHPPRRLTFAVLAAVLLLPLTAWLPGQVAPAQTAREAHRTLLLQQREAQRALWLQQKKHNDNALLILSGRPGTTYFELAHDIADALASSGDGLRVVAVESPGGIETLRDLLLLRGMDLALVPTNVLAYANVTTAFGPRLQERLTYVARLYSEEVHILVGAGINSFQELSGKKIAVSAADGNAEFTVRDLLRRLHVESEVVKMAAPDAIDDVRSGTLAALALVGGKPLRLVAGLPKDGSLRLLTVPTTDALGDDYSPAGFRSDDYPALIPDGQTIDTVAVAAVLVANDTSKSDDSNRRIARFAPAFFGALQEFAGPQWHPKWREVNLAATLPGWPRFAAAREWLDRTKRDQMASVQNRFEEFLRTRFPGQRELSPELRKQLFEEFVKWTRSSIETAGAAPRP
jgi:uncharacterized protein